MSGGSWDRAMAFMENEEGVITVGRDQNNYTGFNGLFIVPTGDENSLTDGIDLPEEKYYDIYGYSPSLQIYSKRILGDATSEFGPFEKVMNSDTVERRISSWYRSYSDFIQPTYSSFARGYAYYGGNNSEVLAFAGNYRMAWIRETYRIILTPTGGAS